MCHASWRERRRYKSYYSSHDPDPSEHHEPGEHRAHRHHREQRVCFMPEHGRHGRDADRFEGRAGFGVRRPLRFLAHKLDLNEKQITELVRILDELKTERAQAEVDDRRSLAEFADAVASDEFDLEKATRAGERRVQSTARVRDTLIHALQQIHALLEPEQRQRLAYLIRSGVLTV
jgi:Spy/CpxP family protein refolding chaperone